MNAERLNAIAKAVTSDYQSLNISQMLRKLVSSLQDQVSQNNAPEYQNEVANARGHLSDALGSSATNTFSPTWREAIHELGIDDVLGLALFDQIEATFSRNLITPAAALEELKTLSERVDSVMLSLENLSDAFQVLRIRNEDLAPGECEIGVLIPRQFVSNELSNLGDEFQDLDQILGVFDELATGSRSGFKVRTISSTDFSVFLDSTHAVCACLAVALERLIALYKQLLEIRKLRAELEKQGVKELELAGVSAHAENKMSDGIDGIVHEMMTEYKKNPERDKELTIELRRSLKRLAGRIDRGFNLEVRMRELPEEASRSPADQAAAAKASSDFNRIKAASKTLKFLKVEGDPILSLGQETNAQQQDGSHDSGGGTAAAP